MNKQQKSQDLRPENTLPAVQPPETLVQLDADVAALAAEAGELIGDDRVGNDLKFRKGKWTQIVDEEEVKIGVTTPFLVDVLSYKRGWIKWIDKKPVQKIIGRPIDGFISPMRERLDDL
jgi:hypothetical protein